MIQQNLYVVLDAKAEHYLPPFCSYNDATARRQFANAATTAGHEFNQNAADFTLWRIGQFDAASGSIETENAPAYVAGASEELEQARRLQLEQQKLEAI